MEGGGGGGGGGGEVVQVRRGRCRTGKESGLEIPTTRVYRCTRTGELN